MVEKDTESPKRGSRGADWIAVHQLWAEGHDAAWIAAKFGLTRRYVSSRCGWIDAHFPPGAPLRFKAGLARRLEAALATLERGEAAEADRHAKALLTIIRAAKAVEEWTMDNRTAAEPAQPEPEAKAEHDPRAELERRINNLVAEEFKREPYTAGAERSGAARVDLSEASGKSGDDT